ncbi:MAG: ribosomal protein S19 family protein [Candidatus Micrarchaeota archaeon]
MAKKFSYHGHGIEELKAMPLDKFSAIIPSKIRRTLRRMSYRIKAFIEKLRKTDSKKTIRTHLREMPVIPEMVDRKFQVYNGKEWVIVVATPAMLGKRLGEYSITTKLVKHSGPGIGATRGSKSVELK